MESDEARPVGELFQDIVYRDKEVMLHRFRVEYVSDFLGGFLGSKGSHFKQSSV